MRFVAHPAYLGIPERFAQAATTRAPRGLIRREAEKPMRVRIAVVAFALCVEAAHAQPQPPMPPPRPAVPPSQPAPVEPKPEIPRSSLPPASPPAAEADPCLASLKAAGFESEPAEPPRTLNELCRIETPVRLKMVPVPSRPGTAVHLTDQPVLACRFAERLRHWIGDLAAPLVAGASRSELKAVRTGPGFECRNRNGAATGKLSAHA